MSARCSIDDIVAFLRQETGVTPGRIRSDADRSRALGVEGDDFFELMEKYRRRFGVDISGYRWYFHHGEEGFNPLWLILRPPNQRVTHIPVTPALLLACANSGAWTVDYPPHSIPKRRWDTIAFALCLVLALGWLIWA